MFRQEIKGEKESNGSSFSLICWGLLKPISLQDSVDPVFEGGGTICVEKYMGGIDTYMVTLTWLQLFAVHFDRLLVEGLQFLLKLFIPARIHCMHTCQFAPGAKKLCRHQATAARQ
jgi:hypothetical protein